MYIEQIYTNCLSEASYYIESAGEAVIIDPLRDTDKYLALAAQRNCTIKYIFETHFHADFVSGHLELAHQTGAAIVYGPNAKTNFAIQQVADGEIIKLGQLQFKVLHTPGHTMESTCFLLQDETGKDYAVFTGDTLFVGDVGRPDLFGAVMSKEELAGYLYDSLQQKLKPLADHVIVYPAHGPGSSCGKNLGKETFSTIGTQKASNYALKDMSKESFIQEVTSGLSTPPQYFPFNAKINREGYALMENLKSAYVALTPSAVAAHQANGVVVIDSRTADEFTEGFIPESIFIGLDGRFAEWAGSLIPLDKTIILVTAAGKEQESMTRLARVGFDHIIGYLSGGFEAWKTAGMKIDMIINVDADELRMDMQFDEKLSIIDVRKPSEFANGHIDVALNFSLADLESTIADLPNQDNLYVHCAGGYRSVIAASIMKKYGIHTVRNVLGGWAKITEVTDMPLALPSKSAALN